MVSQHYEGWGVKPAWATLWVWSKPGLCLKQTNKLTMSRLRIRGMGWVVHACNSRFARGWGRTTARSALVWAVELGASWQLSGALFKSSEGWRCSLGVAEISVPVPRLGKKPLNNLCTDIISLVGKKVLKLSTQDNIKRLNVIFYLWIDIQKLKLTIIVFV